MNPYKVIPKIETRSYASKEATLLSLPQSCSRPYMHHI